MAEKKEKSKKEAKRKSGFFTGLVAELKRVVWPDQKKLLHSVAAVLVIAIAFAILIWVVDSLVYGGLNWIGFHKPNEIHTQSESPIPSAIQPVVPAESSVGK